jgi:glycosyltransferase involved in cell wall biosynthesis
MVKRAVVLVGGPAAPYSRAIRVARALAAEGLAVEIAAVAAPALPDREPVALPAPGTAGDPDPERPAMGSIEIRRYRPSGPRAWIGASEGTTAAPGGESAAVPGPAPSASAPRRLSPHSRVARTVIRPILVLRRWLFWPHTVRGWWATLDQELAPADLYHAFGTLTVAAALRLRDRRPVSPSGDPAHVIYDAIDDAVGSNAARGTPRPILRRRARVEAGWARAADAVVTVNAQLAERLAARWRLDASPLVMPNVPEPAGTLTPVDIRGEAGLQRSTRVILFGGRLGPDLGLEAAAEAVLMVPDAALVLLGFGRGFDAARARDRDPRYAGRHVTLPARPPDEVLAWTAAADVAIVPLPPVSANQRASTPNKFWEAIAAGTPVVIGPGLTAMEGLVREHDLGVVAAGPEPWDLARAIEAALDRLDGPDGETWRRQIAAVAAERFGWPPIATAYRSLVRSLLDPRSSPAEPSTTGSA